MTPDFKAWRLDKESWQSATQVGIADRGFRYGASVFETVYLHFGRPVFWKEHLCRFALARQCLGINDVIKEDIWSPLLNEVTDVLCGKCGILRLVATEGDGGIQEAPDPCSLFAYVESLPHAAVPSESFPVIVFGEPYSPVLHGHKTGSYLFHLRARRHAHASGVCESILSSASGDWICASMANLFIVTATGLRTPPCSSGARDGVVRNWVLGQEKVELAPITREDAREARGIFLTNSRLGVQEITAIDGIEVARSEKVDSLKQAYADLLTKID